MLLGFRPSRIIGHSDSGVVSGHKSSEGRSGGDPEFGGYESLKAVRLHGDRLRVDTLGER